MQSSTTPAISEAAVPALDPATPPMAEADVAEQGIAEEIEEVATAEGSELHTA